MVAIILEGGTRAQQDVYTGVAGELSYESESPELRLHDGVSPGGLRILGLIANDLRYQLTNNDLTALAAFGTEQGFMARLGPGNYIHRAIVGTAGEVTVANGLGSGGNVTISLPDTITAALTFEAAIVGDISFTAPAFIGDLTGDVTGNLTGNVTGNVVGNLTGDVLGDVIGNIAGTLTGSFDVSGGSIAFAAGQIPDAALTENYVLTGANTLVPAGVIAIWSGTLGSIPSGWVACDGTSGTPDLQDQFVICTGVTYPRATTGGTATHTPGTIASASAGGHTPTVNIASHVLTEAELPVTQVGCGIGLSSGDSQVPNHGTRAQSNPNRSLTSDGDAASTEPLTQAFGSGDGHGHTGSSVAVPNHSHDVVIGAQNHIPPYYSLIYIMKS